MTTPRLDLTRSQIIAYRQKVQALDARLPAGPESLRRAAWAGLQDSMPRAAVLSIHARVEGTTPTTWEDPSLAQVWGPRFSAYVVAREDVPIFTLGRLPDEGPKRRFAVDMADRVEAFLNGRKLSYSEVGHGLGLNPNALRYGTTTGRLLIRWEGARRPLVWTIPPPDIEPFEARLELARRYLRAFAPGTVEGFADWAGIKPVRARAAFDGLAGSLTPVSTPIGDGWILAADEPALLAAAAAAASPAPARLLPSGDTFYLLQGNDRELLVPDPAQRGELWTSRVWPGAVLVRGEVVGTWRRGGHDVSIQAWRRLDARDRAAVEAEAASLPLPDLRSQIVVRWGD